VKIGKHLSSEFKVNKSLRQGDAISTLLFNLVLEIASRRSKVATRVTIFDNCIKILAYSDVMIIMGRRLKDVGVIRIYVTGRTNKMELKLNGKKAEFMVVSRKPYSENKYVKLGTYNIEIVEDYTYVGTILTKVN